jgi:hypothetical protein
MVSAEHCGREARHDRGRRKADGKRQHFLSMLPAGERFGGRAVVESACLRSDHQAYAPTSAAVAANDIWKLGPITSCGEMAMTTMAETARLRMVNAARSKSSAVSITASIMKLRCAATSPPEMKR